jgi:ATPase subunit of ABC transporter with duplicated ATPase domains
MDAPTSSLSQFPHAFVQALLTELCQQLAELDDDAAEGKARQIMGGLGLRQDKMDAPTSSLSGFRMHLCRHF